jgi:hypothetical protein
MENFETIYEVENKTYANLFHIAEYLLGMAERIEDGSLLNTQAATVFYAFAFEAYLNHVGEEEIIFWGEIDRISYRRKLTILQKHLHFDDSRPELQTVRQLFELRNKLAHGRTVKETITQTTDSELQLEAVFHLSPWEKLTPENVRQYHDHVSASIALINFSRKKPDKLLWDLGSCGPKKRHLPKQKKKSNAPRPAP